MQDVWGIHRKRTTKHLTIPIKWLLHHHTTTTIYGATLVFMKVFNILLFLLSVVHGTNIGTNEISLKLARNFAHNKLSILDKGEKKYFDVLVW